MSSFWWSFLPIATATLAVISLLKLGVCQALEVLTYQGLFLLQEPIHLQSWLWIVLLFVGIGSGGMLQRLRFRDQLSVLLLLCLGWGLLSLTLVPYGVKIPVVTPILLFGLSGGMVALAEVVRTYLLLRQSEERYALAVRGSSEGLWDWNLRTDRVYFSPRWKEMLGYLEHQLSDSPQEWLSRVHPADLELLKVAIADHLRGNTSHFENEHRLLHQNGTHRWMLSRGLAVRNREGKAERMVGSQTDITSRKQTEEELWRSAFFDKLTNLPNRPGFINYLRQAITRIQHPPMTVFAVLWLDLDRFKVVNNSLGSAIGDRLLIAVSQRLRAFLSSDDVTARMGGDEFAVLLDQVQDANDAIRMAERVQQVLALPFNMDGREVFLTVSIGIALSSTHYTDPEHLLRDADTAMHRAKAHGRARCQVFDKAMRTRMVVKLLLENDLRRAIAQEAYDKTHELQLYYQPIVRLVTRQVVGFEALVRWQHPEQGILSPTKFISMAEETGLIIPLSWWVLRAACRQMRQWLQAFPNQPFLTINVNLSTQQFSMSGLTEYICQILEETELDGTNLKLEMTESMVMENAAAIVAVLHQLRSFGIQLAIDDFGTGYSSLSYLARFPINTLKIDRSFVRNIGISSDSLEIVRTILALAHNLGMDVTAEGVETPEQANQLLGMHCEYGQGYFFAQPLDADAATNFLEQQK
ncbi:MAG: EAL domain-containing protein [Cyanobacteria bacterium CRU_2_1]|nr:EAL domain-containing protein [Cyanobacteria bacterium CRU_2_1]